MKKNISLKLLLLSAVSLFSLNTLAQIIEDKERRSNHPILRYSMHAIERPSVVPVGMINVDFGVTLTGFNTPGMKLGAQFGIVNGVEGLIGWDGLKFNKVIDPTTGKKANFVSEKTINLGLKYKYLALPHLSFAATLDAPFHVLDGEIFRSLTLGVPISMYNNMMAGGILGDFLQLTMRPNVEMDLRFKIWYGVQVYGNLWAQLNSSLGHITMKNPANQAQWMQAWFWKEVPLNLNVVYALLPQLDVSGTIGFDNLFKAKDSMTFGIGVAFRAGRLFG